MLAYSTAEKRRGPLAQWNFEPKDLGDGGQRRECSLIPLNGTTILLSEFSLCLSHLIHILSFFLLLLSPSARMCPSRHRRRAVLEDQLKSGPEMTRIEHLSDLHYPDADPPCHFCSNQSSLSIHDSNRLKIVSGGINDDVYVAFVFFFQSIVIFFFFTFLPTRESSRTRWQPGLDQSALHQPAVTQRPRRCRLSTLFSSFFRNVLRKVY